MKRNPAYKGPWTPPMISNPAYKVQGRGVGGGAVGRTGEGSRLQPQVWRARAVLPLSYRDCPACCASRLMSCLSPCRACLLLHSSQGPWVQKTIPNPDYHEDTEPLKHIGNIGAIAFEVGQVISL